MKFGIIGCGLIGQKRAKAISKRHDVKIFADIDLELATKISANYPSSTAVAEWKEVVTSDEIDAVIIATPHSVLTPICKAALECNKHILVEKPAGRSRVELESLVQLAERNQHLKVHVGYNHRYHRAFLKMQEIVSSGDLGELLFLRSRYGHGGRVGYESEWRANPEVSGGGELIDQGSHLIDLASVFLPELELHSSHYGTYFWDMPVEDNAFLLLKNQSNQVAFLHASCTEWKNTFSFELYGKYGKLEVSGLGGSYGTEKLTYYKMSQEMGPPLTYAWEFPMADNSWEVEVDQFIKEIEDDTVCRPSINEAYRTLEIIEEIYKAGEV